MLVGSLDGDLQLLINDKLSIVSIDEACYTRLTMRTDFPCSKTIGEVEAKPSLMIVSKQLMNTHCVSTLVFTW